MTGIINISLRTKATNAKVCEVQHHNLKVNVQQQHILQKLDEIWVTYYHSIHQSINQSLLLYHSIEQMKDKENEENMNMNYHNYKMHVSFISNYFLY